MRVAAYAALARLVRLAASAVLARLAPRAASAALARLAPLAALAPAVGLALGLALPAAAGEPAPAPGSVPQPSAPAPGSAPAPSASAPSSTAPGAPPAEAAPDASAADLLLEEEYDAAVDERDPLEPSNRVFFRGNEVLYRQLFDPLADVYAFVFPEPARRSFVRFFQNLGEPADFLNELLQLNPRFAGRTGARFVLNSTVGIGGLFDPAERLGLPPRATDFGETLGAYGVGEGWYLVVPLLGPSTVRDLFGDVVDGFFHPQAYFLGYTTQLLIATGSGFSRYEAERERLDALRQSSLDFYAALRSAYRMQRAASVRDARAESPVLRHLGDGAATAAVAAPGGAE